MSHYYVKKHLMHSFIDWETYAYDRAELHCYEVTEILNGVVVSKC